MVYNECGHEYVEILSTGTETWAALLSRLSAAIDRSKVALHKNGKVVINHRQLYTLNYIDTDGQTLYFSYTDGASLSQSTISEIIIKPQSSGCKVISWMIKPNGISVSDGSSAIPIVNARVRFYYS